MDFNPQTLEDAGKHFGYHDTDWTHATKGWHVVERRFDGDLPANVPPRQYLGLSMLTDEEMAELGFKKQTSPDGRQEAFIHPQLPNGVSQRVGFRFAIQADNLAQAYAAFMETRNREAKVAQGDTAEQVNAVKRQIARQQILTAGQVPHINGKGFNPKELRA